MITKDNIISAYFIDEARENIEVLTTSEDGTKVIPIIVPLDENHPNFIELNGLVSLDQLHENTYEKKKEERKIFVQKVKEIAKKEGLIKQIMENVDPDFFKLLFDFLLSDKQEHIDRLFNFKIFIFEQDVVKNSKNETAKTAIRKSKTPLEALDNFLIIWKESN
jgi:hypothetical protein|tara:strand:- start:588 stop:1079 length:492 start_codon:yes stop_codon:yes gene_type:complete